MEGVVRVQFLVTNPRIRFLLDYIAIMKNAVPMEPNTQVIADCNADGTFLWNCRRLMEDYAQFRFADDINYHTLPIEWLVEIQRHSGIDDDIQTSHFAERDDDFGGIQHYVNSMYVCYQNTLRGGDFIFANDTILHTTPESGYIVIVFKRGDVYHTTLPVSCYVNSEGEFIPGEQIVLEISLPRAN